MIFVLNWTQSSNTILLVFCRVKIFSRKGDQVYLSIGQAFGRGLHSNDVTSRALVSSDFLQYQYTKSRLYSTMARLFQWNQYPPHICCWYFCPRRRLFSDRLRIIRYSSPFSTCPSFPPLTLLLFLVHEYYFSSLLDVSVSHLSLIAGSLDYKKFARSYTTL